MDEILFESVSKFCIEENLDGVKSGDFAGQ